MMTADPLRVRREIKPLQVKLASQLPVCTSIQNLCLAEIRPHRESTSPRSFLISSFEMNYYVNR
jgi:hypothetical protein